VTDVPVPRPRLAEIDVAADPAAWTRLGFAVDAASASLRLGTTTIRLGGTDGDPGAGMTGWTLAGEAVLGDEGPIDGLPTSRVAEAADTTPGGEHPNGATRLDHVVVMTPALDRTLAALRAAGLDLRRVREAGGGFRQGFFRLADDVIVEVGGDAPDLDPTEPARFWGLVAVVPDVDALAASLGPSLVGEPKDAVQPGRRIVTVRREAGAGLPLAFLTPHVRRT
jgi:hypothetical protein